MAAKAATAEISSAANCNPETAVDETIVREGIIPAALHDYVNLIPDESMLCACDACSVWFTLLLSYRYSKRSLDGTAEK